MLLFASICALFSSYIGEGHNWVSIYWTRMQFEREKCDNSSDDAKIILRIFVVVFCLRPGLEFLLGWHGQFSVCADFYSSLLGEAHNLRCFHWAKSDGGSWGLWADPAMVILWRWLCVCAWPSLKFRLFRRFGKCSFFSTLSPIHSSQNVTKCMISWAPMDRNSI